MDFSHFQRSSRSKSNSQILVSTRRSRSRSSSSKSRSKSRSRSRSRSSYYEKKKNYHRYHRDSHDSQYREMKIVEDLRRENDKLHKELAKFQKAEVVTVRFHKSSQAEKEQQVDRSTSPGPGRQQQFVDQASQTESEGQFKALDGILELWKSYKDSRDASTNTDKLTKQIKVVKPSCRDFDTQTEIVTQKNTDKPKEKEIVGVAVEVTEKGTHNSTLTDLLVKNQERYKKLGYRISQDKNKKSATTTTTTQQVQSQTLENSNKNPNAKNQDSNGQSSEDLDNERRVNSENADNAWPIIVSCKGLSFSEDVIKQMDLAENGNQNKESSLAVASGGAGQNPVVNKNKAEHNSPTTSTTSSQSGLEEEEEAVQVEEEEEEESECGQDQIRVKFNCQFCTRKFRVVDRYHDHIKRRIGYYQNDCKKCKSGFLCHTKWRNHNQKHLNRFIKTLGPRNHLKKCTE